MEFKLKNLSVLLAATLFTLIVLEILFTLFFSIPELPLPSFTTCNLKAYIKNEVPRYRPNQECYQCYYRNNQNLYFDKTASADGKKYDCIQYRIGEEGFRTPRFDKERSEKARIVTIGDSFTFGEGVKEPDTFPRLLEKNLSIETINISMQGLNTEKERLILEQNMALSPDLLILGYILNDTMPHQETISAIDEMEENSLVPDWIQASNLFTILYRRVVNYYIARKHLKSYLEWFEKGWHASAVELSAIKDLCDQNNVRFLLVLFPIFVDLNDNYPFNNLHDQINRFAKENHIDAIDLLPAFKDKKAEDYQVHPLDHHPNHKAHKIVALEIQKWIEKNFDYKKGAMDNGL